MTTQTLEAPSDATRWYSVATIADLLGVSVATVWRWSANGKTPRLHQIGPNVTRGKSSDWNEFLLDPAHWRAEHEKVAA